MMFFFSGSSGLYVDSTSTTLNTAEIVFINGIQNKTVNNAFYCQTAKKHQRPFQKCKLFWFRSNLSTFSTQ